MTRFTTTWPSCTRKPSTGGSPSASASSTRRDCPRARGGRAGASRAPAPTGRWRGVGPARLQESAEPLHHLGRAHAVGDDVGEDLLEVRRALQVVRQVAPARLGVVDDGADRLAHLVREAGGQLAGERRTRDVLQLGAHAGHPLLGLPLLFEDAQPVGVAALDAADPRPDAPAPSSTRPRADAPPRNVVVCHQAGRTSSTTVGRRRGPDTVLVARLDEEAIAARAGRATSRPSRSAPASTQSASTPSTRKRKRMRSGYSSSKAVKPTRSRAVSGGTRTVGAERQRPVVGADPLDADRGRRRVEGNAAGVDRHRPRRWCRTTDAHRRRRSRPGCRSWPPARPAPCRGRRAPASGRGPRPPPQLAPLDDGHAPVGRDPHAPASIVEDPRDRVVRQPLLDGQARDAAPAQAADAAAVGAIHTVPSGSATMSRTRPLGTCSAGPNRSTRPGRPGTPRHRPRSTARRRGRATPT